MKSTRSPQIEFCMVSTFLRMKNYISYFEFFGFFFFIFFFCYQWNIFFQEMLRKQLIYF